MENAARSLPVGGPGGPGNIEARLVGVNLAGVQANGVEKSRQARQVKRTPHPATSEKEYSDEEMQVLTAIRTYQIKNDRKFPSHTEILGVLKGMGYIRVSHGFKLVPIADAEEQEVARRPQPHIRLFQPEA